MLCLGKGFRWGKNWDVKNGVLSIGHYAYIGPRAQIIYPTVIGDLVMISADVHIVGNDHGYQLASEPIRITQPLIDPNKMVTIIESDAWIGQRATILHGLTIGRGSIVGAGSVVTRDVPRYSIVAGVPARFIKARFPTGE